MRYEPKPGDIGLSYSQSFLGKLVRWLQALIGDWAPYSHAFIVLHDGYIMEAMPGGARVEKLYKYRNTELVFSKWELDPDHRNRICEEALRLEGTPYSFLDFLYLGMNHYPKWVPKWVRNRIKKRVLDSGNLICSQLCAEAYKRTGIDITIDDREPLDLTPADLAGILLRVAGENLSQRS